MSSLGCQSYTINGIKVQFPHKAYPSQLSMMDKIIKGLERRQNCLLESPTGSGKSLALLCSALAWQRHETEKSRMEEKESSDNESCCTCGNVEKTDTGASTPPYYAATNQEVPTTANQTVSVGHASNPIEIDDTDNDDFKTDSKRFRTPVGLAQPQCSGSPIPDIEDVAAPQWKMEAKSEGCCSCTCGASEIRPKRKIPKIWFGTRTHKQVAQITRELGKTAYSGARMTILSSREHSCIHPQVSTMSSKNEECKNLLDGPGCRWYDNVRRKISHASLRLNGLTGAWDLEEFKGFCRKAKACSYFGGRELKGDAEVIFCPYNYLVDPNIRESLEIILKDQIVILDEAHNIEDSSREAASNTLHQKDVADTIDDLNKMIGMSKKVKEHRVIRDMMTGFHNLIENHRETTMGDNFDTAYKMWSGMEMVAQLKICGVTPANFNELKSCYNEIAQEDTDEKQRRRDLGEQEAPALKANTRKVLGSLFTVLDFVIRGNMKYMQDYRLTLVKTMTYVTQDNSDGPGGWLNRNKRRRQQRQMDWSFSLNFWCLNPAVAFNDLGIDCRSVILTSGTLSPMNSFQSELDVAFPIQLEASHVIGKSQVWVGTISKGPRGASLLGNYQNSETFAYQDDVGETLLEICKTVPHGVLCFVSSYKTVEKFFNRWKNTGLYERLGEHKVVMSEPKASERVDFDDLIRQYYDTIEEYEDVEAGEGITGALFVAVCRGKVSEGLDFADNNARAVVTVGIPFPHVKDPQVDLKKQYNNQHSMQRGLLKGGEWYEIQAYRALNQALGRCIRHRNDWGALILIDERFGKCPQRYIKGLSKWVRQKVQHFYAFNAAKHSLAKFTQERLASPITNDVSVMNLTSTSTFPSSGPSTPNVTSTSKTPPEFKTPYGTSTPAVENATLPEISNLKAAQNVLIQQTASPVLSQKSVSMIRNNIQQGSLVAPNNVQQTTSVVQQKLVLNPSQILALQGGGFLLLTQPSGTFPSYANQSNPEGVTAVYTEAANNALVIGGKPGLTNQHQTVVDSSQTTQTQAELGSKTIVSGDTEVVEDSMEGFIDIDEDDLEFNPAVASTQISATQKCKTSMNRRIKEMGKTCKGQVALFDTPDGKENIKGNANIINKHANIQLDDGVISNKTEDKKKKPGVREKLMRYSFGGNVETAVAKQENDSKMNQRYSLDSKLTKQKPVKSNQNMTESENKNSLFQFVDIPLKQDICTTNDKKHTVSKSKTRCENETRTSSPELFDSDNEVMSCDNELDEVIKDMCTDVTLVKDADKRNEKLAVSDCSNIAVVKPLFKSTYKQTDSKTESVSEETTNLNSMQKDSANSTTLESKDHVTRQQSRKHFTDKSKLRTRRSNSANKDNVNCDEEHEKENQKEQECCIVLKSEKVDEKHFCEIVDEPLMTRRGSRAKRRRLIGGKEPMNKKQKLKGVDFIDDVEPTKTCTLQCLSCHKMVLSDVKGYTSEVNLPHYIKKLAKEREVIVIKAEHITGKIQKEFPLQLAMSDGSLLNSYWSDGDDCCYKYLFCSCDQTILGLQVKCVGDRSHPSLQQGQIWIFKDKAELVTEETLPN